MSRYQPLVDEDWVQLCDNLWQLLTGTILDTRIPLERLYIVLQNLKDKSVLDYRNLSKFNEEERAEILKDCGYNFYNSKARFFEQDIDFDLETATFEQMKSIYGIGDKLASMWMAIVHGSNEYPILDTHVLRFLKEKGYTSKIYKELSEAFKKEAQIAGLTVLELDKQIVEQGIRKRRGI